MYACTHARSHVRTHARKYARTLAHTHAYMHAHTHTHTHARTHARIPCAHACASHAHRMSAKAFVAETIAKEKVVMFSKVRCVPCVHVRSGTHTQTPAPACTHAPHPPNPHPSIHFARTGAELLPLLHQSQECAEAVPEGVYCHRNRRPTGLRRHPERPCRAGGGGYAARWTPFSCCWLGLWFSWACNGLLPHVRMEGTLSGRSALISARQCQHLLL